MRARLRSELADAYGQFWSDLGVTHELTISVGFTPRSFSPEEELLPVLRNLVREGATKLRGLPKRKALALRHDDPKALVVAGFFEARKWSGELFPHWHGAVALGVNEERGFRDLLWQCIGEDADNPLEPWETPRTTRPLIRTRGAKPTFHLTPLGTVPRYARYANKNTYADDVIHWTTADLLS